MCHDTPLKGVAFVCRVNDRIISANGVSLENVEYATAVQVLRDSGNTVLLVVRRRVVLPACPEPQTLKLSLTKSKKKDGKISTFITSSPEDYCFLAPRNVVDTCQRFGGISCLHFQGTGVFLLFHLEHGGSRSLQNNETLPDSTVLHPRRQ